MVRCDPMRPAALLALPLGVVLTAAPAHGQDASARAWQQRLTVSIPIRVPLVELESVNPFATTVDSAPVRQAATPPRKLPVAGRARVAAYVDGRGDCLGAVPLELPFQGLTTAVTAGFAEARFEPARAGNQPRPTWVVVEVGLEATVKESSVASERLEMPDPGRPPAPAEPTRLEPSTTLLALPATSSGELSSGASPKRVSIRVPGREVEVPLRALVHVDAEGRCDRYVPLEHEEGLSRWLEAFLASWRLDPARRGGEPVGCWVLYTARVRLALSAVESSSFRVVPGQSYPPPG